MDYREFKVKITKAEIPRKSKVRNSWGVYDSYKQIRKNQWYDIGRPLKEHEFYSIIRTVNNLLAEELANGNTVVFPYRMGKLELRKYKPEAKIVKGKLKITYPINWEETLKLWFNDHEARKNKMLLRNESEYIYYIKYNKYSVNYRNQSFYEFEVNRKIKQSLKDNIKKGKVDALW